jgi:hypothetical protein
MLPTAHRTMIPVERYRTILAALATEQDQWKESFWLRFAAQAAVLDPAEPADIARRIRACAAELHRLASWYQTLAGPARFIVAALLVAHRIAPADFVAERQRVGAMLHHAGLGHGHFHEIMAVLVLMLWPGGGTGVMEIARVRAIYDRMKGYHAWIAGIHALPDCAAMAQCPEHADALMARAEDIFQQLLGAGLPRDRRLLVAANILTLTGLPANQAISRYLGLTGAMKELYARPGEDTYDPLALLALLDQEPAKVIGRWTATLRELNLFQPEEAGETNALIAADLTFLDLVHGDGDRHPATAPKQAMAMLDRLHAYHLASAVLISHAEPRFAPVVEGYQPWPLM